MERLQAAIEKARAQREERRTRPVEDAAGPYPVRSQRPAAEAEAPPAPDAVESAWRALAPISLREPVLHRNRVTAYHPGRPAAPFDMLRTRMLQQAQTHGWRRIAIVSPHSACGKSTTAANLAFSLARQRGLRALILDMDMRRAGLGRILGQQPDSGMADVLEGSVSFSSHGLRYGDSVAFGLSRGGVKTPSEILQSRQARSHLERIEATYAPDIVLFDMPPLMASDDNFGFLQNVDAALILVAAEKTSMTKIDVAERQVAELTNVMGIVLNRCRYTDGAYGNEYDYY
jgi:Mrp family chromosome partitioning ATPase